MGGGETFCRDIRSNSPRGNGRESEDHDSPPLFFGLVSAPLISLLFKTRIRSPSPVTRNRDGISFDDSRAPGLLSFRISSAAFLFFLDLHVPSSVIEISSILLRSIFFPFRIRTILESRNSSRILERGFKGEVGLVRGRRGGVQGQAVSKTEGKMRGRGDRGEHSSPSTRRVHFPRRGGVDSLCVLGGPGPRLL